MLGVEDLFKREHEKYGPTKLVTDIAKKRYCKTVVTGYLGRTTVGPRHTACPLYYVQIVFKVYISLFLTACSGKSTVINLSAAWQVGALGMYI